MRGCPMTVVRRKRSRWLRWLFLGAVVALIVAVVSDQFIVRRQRQRLANKLAELDSSDPGWRLEDIESARMVVAESENSANTSRKAFELLPKEFSSYSNVKDFVELPAERVPSEATLASIRAKYRDASAAAIVARKIAASPADVLPFTTRRTPGKRS